MTTTTTTLKAYVEGVGFRDAITPLFRVTLCDTDYNPIAGMTVRVYMTGTTRTLEQVVDDALYEMGARPAGPLVPHEGRWECWAERRLTGKVG